MSALEELLARIEAATGPDRGLDAEIDVAFQVGNEKMEPWVWKNFPLWRPALSIGAGVVEVVHVDGKGGLNWRSQPFTASIDAASALAKSILPPIGWMVCEAPEGPEERIVGVARILDDTGEIGMAQAATPALALLAALLRALPSPVHPQGS